MISPLDSSQKASIDQFSMGSSEEYGGEKTVPSSSRSADHDIHIGDIVDHGAESELQRRLSSRHVTMIALGSSIGMGLWLGSGTSLANGGPAALFIGCEYFNYPSMMYHATK